METQRANWNAVWAMTIGVAGLIIAEFLPAGVLTPMARDLGITEGMAGQTVTVTSVIAVITSLLIAYVSRNYNRRHVLLALSFLLTVSSLVVAFAPNFVFLLAGRVLLGISLGGFWSMATAITIRLVPEDDVPKALSIIFGGSSFASVFAAPLGSFLGEIIGWRDVFIFAAGVGMLALLWQFMALPSLKPVGKIKLRTTVDVLRAPQFLLGLFAIAFVFCGRFASFTYLRPFLEQTSHLGSHAVSAALLIFGFSYFVGNWFAPGLLKRNFKGALWIPPTGMAASAFALMFFGQYALATFILIFLLGSFFGPVPPAWSTWVAKKVPENAETGGGLYVASVQLAAAIGAFAGGLAFDFSGSAGVFALSGISWALSAILVLFYITSPTSRFRETTLSKTESVIIALE